MSTPAIEALTDLEVRLVFQRELDGIAESCVEFIRDDGPLGAPGHVADLAAALRLTDQIDVWLPG